MGVHWLKAGDPRLETWWPSSMNQASEDVERLLESARIQCEAYAPALAEDDPRLVQVEEVGETGEPTGRIHTEPPANYLHAQALQARDLERAGISQPRTDEFGYGESPRLFPMDWTVKALLRPPTGKPVIA